MMEEFKKQAERFGAEVRFGIATKVDFSGKTHKVIIDENKKIEADAVIIATGATAKYLGLEAESRYAGMGVSACATCDGFFYKGRMWPLLEEAILQQKKQPTWQVCAGKSIW